MTSTSRRVPARARADRRDHWTWAGYAAPCLVAWSAVLLALWPGLMSNDSIDQWSQLATHRFENYHPAFHTLMLWLVTRPWRSPASVAIAQIVVLAAVFAAAVRELARWGTPTWVRVALTAAFSSSLVNGLMVVTLWKDVPYAIASLGVAVALLHSVRTRGAWIASWTHAALLGFGVIVMALTRHNGPFVVAPLLLALPWTWRRWRMRFAVLGLACLAACLVIVGPLYRAVHVHRIPPAIALQYPMQQIAAVVHDGGALTAEQEARLDAILPLEHWRHDYNCYSADPIVHSSALKWRYINTHAADVRALWQELVWAHAGVLLAHQRCANSMVWRIDQPPDGFIIVPPIPSLYPGRNSRWPWLAERLTALRTWSLEPAHVWWTWRPALYLYATLVCCAVAAARCREWRLLLFGAPALLNSLVWLVFLNAQDFRYQYPVYLIGLVAPGLLAIRRPDTPVAAADATGRIIRD